MRWMVFGCKSDFHRLFFSVGFCFVFMKWKSTQDTRACVSQLLWNVRCHDTKKHTRGHTQTKRHKQTQQCRQQGHVAHNKNTLDSRSQSDLLLHTSPPAAGAFSDSSALHRPVVSDSHVFITFHTQLRSLLCFPQLLLFFHCSHPSLLFCSSHLTSLLSSCFLFALLLSWVSVLRCLFFPLLEVFSFLFEGSIYLYK